MRKQPQLRGMVVGLSILCVMALAGAARAADSTRDSKDPGSAWLGIYSQTLTDDLREGLDYKGEGLLVSRVVPESPADKAGLKKGDVIVTVNSKPPGSSDDLYDLIQGKKVGDTVALGIVRDGKRSTLSAKLAARPDDEDIGTMVERSMRGFDFDDDHGSSHVHVVTYGRGRLGVRVQSLNPDLGSYFSMPGGKGVLVTEVIQDTPAEKAGIKAGDVITKVGTDEIKTTEDLTSALHDKDGKVSIETSRRGTKRTVQVELPESPEVHAWRSVPGQFTWDRGDWDHMTQRMKIKADGADEAVQRELKELREQLKALESQVKELSKSK